MEIRKHEPKENGSKAAFASGTVWVCSVVFGGEEKEIRGDPGDERPTPWAINPPISPASPYLLLHLKEPPNEMKTRPVLVLNRARSGNGQPKRCRISEGKE